MSCYPYSAMIPPADSLLKYDTPVLVSRNTEKRSPKVRTGLKGVLQIPRLKIRNPKGRGLQRLPIRGIGTRKKSERIYRQPRCGV